MKRQIASRSSTAWSVHLTLAIYSNAHAPQLELSSARYLLA
jgi:hypothetical protein